MVQIRKKDFVEIEYTGRTKDDNSVFDTTDEATAKQNELQDANYGPVVICIGENQILPGLDKQLEKKEVGREYKIELKPEDAFGKKDAKLIQLVQTSKFLKQNVQPMPGLQVNIDGMMATIKTVSGGRTLVDFNHPLAGKELVYEVRLNKIVSDDKKKLESFVKISLGLEVEAEIKEGKAKVTIKNEIPKDAKEKLIKKIKEIIPKIEDIEFIIKQEKKKQ